MTSNKTLIIVESPTKAKMIGNMLKDCTVIASEGHIRDLPSDEMGIDLSTLKPMYIIPKEKKAIVQKLKKELASSSRLILATDEDREGESIARHLVDVLSPKVPIGRMVFHEITKKAIEEAFKNTRDIDKHMVEAQEARRVLDRLFGYSISPLLWKKLSISRLSAGRVQSPTLRLVVQREIERLNYKSSEYYTIKTKFKKGEIFSSLLVKIDDKDCVVNKEYYDEKTGIIKNKDNVIILDKEEAERIKHLLENCECSVEDIKQKEIKRLSLPPFITSTLQQDANSKLGYSPKETMRIAQSLYEKGFITYMRTDSPNISEEGLNAARQSVAFENGAEYLNQEIRNFTPKDKNAQEAHECIRPTIQNGVFISPNKCDLAGKEKSLYTLIYRRTVATQMKPSIKLSTQVVINAQKDGHTYTFLARGMEIKYLGFLKTYNVEEDDENTLPHLTKGDSLVAQEVEDVQNVTSPRSRYTEASLIKKMEEIGIGRPSTYAVTISSLISRKYINKEKNILYPTFLGLLLCEFLEKYFKEYVEYNFTSNMEKTLDDIANNTVDSNKYLKEFYNGDNGLLNVVSQKKEEIKTSDAKVVIIPNIDSEKYPIKYGKYGPYVDVGEKEYKAIPQSWKIEDVTEEHLKELIEDNRTIEEKINSTYQFVGYSEKFNKDIYYNEKGKYGPYWLLGDIHDIKNVQFCSIPRGTKASDWTISEIEELFSLPRILGENEKTGKTIMANIGKYGPYVSCEKKFKSIPIQRLLTITLEEALEILNSVN